MTSLGSPGNDPLSGTWSWVSCHCSPLGVLTSLGTKASVLSPSSLIASVGTAASHVPINFPSPQHRHQTSSSGLLSCPWPPWAAVLATTILQRQWGGWDWALFLLCDLSSRGQGYPAATLGTEHPWVPPENSGAPWDRTWVDPADYCPDHRFISKTNVGF